MKLIVGLGNPGNEYTKTRHNVGHLFVEQLQNLKLPNGVVVKKTNTFMNDSGKFLSELISKYKIDLKNLYVAHDDLDIPIGSYKIQFGKGPKDHNGLNDVYDKLSTNEFWHIRIGVDNRPQDNRPLGVEYVLQTFTEGELEIMDKVIKEICKEITPLLL